MRITRAAAMRLWNQDFGHAEYAEDFHGFFVVFLVERGPASKAVLPPARTLVEPCLPQCSAPSQLFRAFRFLLGEHLLQYAC